jgi:hypothetical protein
LPQRGTSCPIFVSLVIVQFTELEQQFVQCIEEIGARVIIRVVIRVVVIFTLVAIMSSSFGQSISFRVVIIAPGVLR